MRRERGVEGLPGAVGVRRVPPAAIHELRDVPDEPLSLGRLVEPRWWKTWSASMKAPEVARALGRRSMPLERLADLVEVLVGQPLGRVAGGQRLERDAHGVGLLGVLDGEVRHHGPCDAA